ncbi:MAG TPA: universal stress protein [Aromatoleum sp.]|uniref:universal stress protein n=1 Tax=Aromatoleum sp. TaxID=2307007 RepID=UPI002B49B651|nr:universal stress protein [Aromatoleum sp.]HJV26994.1 universal stress protein [Aromatoleum sp.]
MYRHLLVPIDGTDLSTETSSNAIDFARTLGAHITFFHAQPDYAAALDGEAEIVRLTSPAKFAYTYEWRVRELLAKAEAAARAFGVPCGSMTAVSDSPARAIIAAARDAACDLIYMASHGRRSSIGMMLGSQTLKVLVNAGMPVLVSATSNPPVPSQVLDVIRDEHRSLAAVLHAWLNLLDAERDAGGAADAELMRTMIHYLKTFSATVHRPKESEYLFSRLRRRSSRYDVDLAELDEQNADHQRLIAELEAAVERHLAGAAPLADVREAVASCERSTWEHMEQVEGRILPGALNHLTPEDWDGIATAFGEGGDPRFRRDMGNEFRQIFSRIVNLAPADGAA